jgi:Flp pilus assembly protein TadD
VQRAIALQPHHASWYQNLSAIYTALGKIPEAKAAYQKSQFLKTRQSKPDDFWQTV